MNKVEQQSRVAAIREYASSVGASLSMVQCYEVLAISNGFKNRHVLAAASKSVKTQVVETSAPPTGGNSLLPRIEVDTPPYTLRELARLDWKFAVLMPIPVSLVGYPDALTAYVSNTLTGSPCELVDFECVIAAHLYPAGYVAMEVRGRVNRPDALAELLASEAKFYHELGEVADALLEAKPFSAVEGHLPVPDDAELVDAPRHKDVTLLAALKRFAESGGTKGEAINDRCEEVALKFESKGTVHSVTLDSLKFATKSGLRSWFVPQGLGLTLQF